MRVPARVQRLPGVVLLLASTGCFTAKNPLGINFFGLEVLPTTTCGTTRSAYPGGAVEVCLQVVMGIGVAGQVDLSLAAPPGIETSLGPSASFFLNEEQSQTVPVTVRVASGTASGTYSVSVDATCCDGADERSQSFDVTVLGDADPPVITVARPQEAAVVALLPLVLEATVLDNGIVWHTTYQLNAGPLEVARDLDDPNRRESRDGLVELTLEVWDLERGVNTLEVVARDGAGNVATTSVSFTYEPRLCEDFEIDLLPAVLEGVSGSPRINLETMLTVTPIGGWTGNLRFDTQLPSGFAYQVFLPWDLTDVAGPVTTTFRTALDDDLVPGETRHVVVRAQDTDDPQTACEVDLMVNVVEPGSVEPPVVTIQSPLDGAVVTDPGINLAGEVTDDGTILRVRYTVRFSPAVETFIGSATGPVAFDEMLTLPDVGISNVVVLAVDEGGRLGSANALVTYQPPGTCAPLEPVADTYIRGGSFADSPFGTSASLLVKGIMDLEFARKSYLVFDVSLLPASFSSVALQLTLNRHATRNPREVSLYGVIDNSDWDLAVESETTLTWNNAPRNDTGSGIAFVGQGTTAADGVRLLETSTLDNADPPGTTYEFDITDYVTWALGNDQAFSTPAPGGDADGLVTLLLAHTAEIVGDDGPLFWSREATDACNRPQLIVR